MPGLLLTEYLVHVLALHVPCMGSMDHMLSSNTFVQYVASNLSDKALQAACGFYSKERGDKLVILHVSDASKKYLARHLLPAHLKSLYVGKAQDQQVALHHRTSKYILCSRHPCLNARQ